MKRLLPLLLALILAGCVGTHFAWSNARAVKVGMTKDEVRQIMGKPYLTTSEGPNDIWQWTYGTGWGTGGNFQIVIKDGKVVEVPRIPDELR